MGIGPKCQLEMKQPSRWVSFYSIIGFLSIHRLFIHSSLPLLPLQTGGLERLLKVGNDVVNVLCAD